MTERLVFDGDCGFCTRAAYWVQWLDRHGRMQVVPLQAAGAPESVGATRRECEASVRWQGADGQRLSGAAAANAALSAALGWRLPMLLYRRTAGLQERVYRWVADNRYRLPGVRPHCAAAPDDCHR